MEIIAIANQKGGCGKTITAVNLAGALAGINKKVLFVDLDPQSHGSSALGIKEQQAHMSTYYIFDAFLNRNTANLATLMKQRYQNLWVVGSHISLSTIEQKMANIKGAVLALSDVLKTEQPEFDYIILDTPPNLGFLTLNALHAASRVIVPLDVSVFSLDGVSQIDSVLELARCMGFKKPQVNFLITLFDCRSNFAKAFLQKAKEHFSAQLMQTVVRSNIKLREAAQAGEVIFEYNPSSNGAKDYIALVKEIAPEFKGESIQMKSSVPESKLSAPEILFKLHAPQARCVYLAGSFNNWSIDESSSMKRLDDGAWVKAITLTKGDYYYKFVVDGEWVEDPANSLTETNAFGGKNSLVVVN